MSGEVLHNAAGEMTMEALPAEEEARAALEAARLHGRLLPGEDVAARAAARGLKYRTQPRRDGDGTR